MTYIMIIMMVISYKATSTTVVEFTSLRRCEEAKTKILRTRTSKSYARVEAICIKK